MLSSDGNLNRCGKGNNGSTHSFNEAKLNNNGSAFVTVLVAVIFLGILLSIILAVSTANLRMKQIEYQMKKNFYSNEQILSDVYNGVGKEATKCFTEAYSAVLAQTTQVGGKAVYETQDAAFEAFAINFVSRLGETFEIGAFNPSIPDTRDILNGYALYSAVAAKVVKYDEIEVVKNPAGVPEQFIICGLTVNYKAVDSSGTETGYESSITTDIVIDIPYVAFFEDSSRILDYALIGNKGIYFRTGSRTVEGNIYAGIDTHEEPPGNKDIYRNENVNGSLNIYDSNTVIDGRYIISKGDINVRRSTLTVKSPGFVEEKPQIWAETLRTAESKNKNDAAESSHIILDGQLFLANDMELNARGSNVTLEGDFYAYNSGIYETQEKKKLEGSYETSGHTQSSAVSINGNNSHLDLSGLDTFVVAGTAYIDFVNNNFSLGGPSGIEEYATGESLALKGNQYMYLAPTECLNVLNPSPQSEAGSAVWLDGAPWFARDKGYLKDGDPLIKKTYTRNGSAYTYFYLNFANDGKREEYANLVLSMVKPDKMEEEMTEEVKDLYKDFNELELEQIWKLKEEIQKRNVADSVRSTIKVADGTDARIYTKGVVVSQESDKETVQQKDSTKALSLDHITQLEKNLLKHYQHLYTMLDPKEDYSLLSEILGSPTSAVLANDSLPVKAYVKTDDLVTNGAGTVYKCQGKYGICKTIIAKIDNYELTSNLSGIVLCDGDVTVKSGVNMEGIIIATGRIYIEGSGTIEASRSVIQAILQEEAENESLKESTDAAHPGYVSTYLLDGTDSLNILAYEAERKGPEYKDRITGTDYTDYISYRNWKKGEE